MSELFEVLILGGIICAAALSLLDWLDRRAFRRKLRGDR